MAESAFYNQPIIAAQGDTEFDRVLASVYNTIGGILGNRQQSQPQGGGSANVSVAAPQQASSNDWMVVAIIAATAYFLLK